MLNLLDSVQSRRRLSDIEEESDKNIGTISLEMKDLLTYNLADVDEDEALNKGIANIQFDKITSDSIVSTVKFEKPEDISVDITEPDVLYFYFKLS